jgi:hypothetical protein
MPQDEAGHALGFSAGKHTNSADPFVTVLTQLFHCGTLRYSGAGKAIPTELAHNNAKPIPFAFMFMPSFIKKVFSK